MYVNEIFILQGYDKVTAKKHLLVFALAAPLAAFVSYFGLVRVSLIVRYSCIIFFLLVPLSIC